MKSRCQDLGSSSRVNRHPITVSRSTYLEFPFRTLLIPGRRVYLLLQLDIFHAIVFLRDMFPIFVDFRGTSIERRPFFVRLKGCLVRMGGNV